MTLESIFSRFNKSSPQDYKGRAVSTTDVIVLRRDGEELAYYCDLSDFVSIPDFSENVESWDNEECEVCCETNVFLTDSFISTDGQEVFVDLRLDMDTDPPTIDAHYGLLGPDDRNKHLSISREIHSCPICDRSFV